MQSPNVDKAQILEPAIPQPRGSEERCSSVVLDLGVDEKAEEVRMTF